MFSTVACNATPARHLCYVDYNTPFPRSLGEFGPPVAQRVTLSLEKQGVIIANLVTVQFSMIYVASV